MINFGTTNNNTMKTPQFFFRCNHCGNLIATFINSGVRPVCCGEPMEELLPNTVEASTEKHLPVFSKAECGFTVHVGSDPHPMTPEHHITFVYVRTENGGQWRELGDKPEAEFCACKDRPVALFAYCNLHGLWMTEIQEDCCCCCNE